MKKVDIIAGARPNFMKIAPIIHSIQKYNQKGGTLIEFRLIHTGQHYDKKMSEDFFTQLNIPSPDLNLGVGSGSQATQTANIMISYEAALKDWKPELCIVVGDVNSTMACAITAKKEGVSVAHVEGGIRSGDLSMPEEINRMVTDSISDYFFTTSESANDNLKREGHRSEKIFFVGNTMIDSLQSNLEKLIRPKLLNDFRLNYGEYVVMTLHRPSNVDDEVVLKSLLEKINKNVDCRIVFPIHPRTRKTFEKIQKKFDNIILSEPMSYLEFIYLIKNSKGVITDSGGITEETTVLGIPCITMRNSTERPETITRGTNILVGEDDEKLEKYLKLMMSKNWENNGVPELWDGKSAERIVETISKLPFRVI